MKTVRSGGPEMLRVLLMYFVVLHHCIVHGAGLVSLSTGTLRINWETRGLLGIDAIAVVAVDCFVLISGYFGISFKIKNVAGLLLRASVYSGGIWIVSHLIGSTGASAYINQYWFVVCYSVMYFLSPFVNRLLYGLSRDALRNLVFVLCVSLFVLNFFFEEKTIGGGYSVVQFLILYVFGRFLKVEFGKAERLRVYWLVVGIIMCAVLIFLPALYFISHGRQAIAWRCFAYHNPLVVIGAGMWVLLFLKFEINSLAICRMSRYVFGVYLLHDNVWVREHIVVALSRVMLENWEHGWLTIPLYALLIFVVCVIADAIMSFPLAWVMERKIVERMSKWFDRVYLID